MKGTKSSPHARSLRDSGMSRRGGGTHGRRGGAAQRRGLHTHRLAASASAATRGECLRPARTRKSADAQEGSSPRRTLRESVAAVVRIYVHVRAAACACPSMAALLPLPPSPMCVSTPVRFAQTVSLGLTACGLPTPPLSPAAPCRAYRLARAFAARGVRGARAPPHHHPWPQVALTPRKCNTAHNFRRS